MPKDRKALPDSPPYGQNESWKKIRDLNPSASKNNIIQGFHSSPTQRTYGESEKHILTEYNFNETGNIFAHKTFSDIKLQNGLPKCNKY